MIEQPRIQNKSIYNILAVLLSLFVLAAVNFNLFDQQPNLALFGMLGLVLVFLRLPLFKCCPDNLPSRIANGVLICAGVGTGGNATSNRMDAADTMPDLYRVCALRAKHA